jgi:sulfite exporter TauE/SafE
VSGVLLAVLGASLLGSLHCAAMCGGLVAAYAPRGGARSHAAYQGGRLTAYALLGALAGGAGRAVDLGAAAAGLRSGAALLSGALLVAWGTHALLVALRGLRPLHAPAALTRLFGRLLARTPARSPSGRAAVLGALSGLLPCGWLWAYVAMAAGAGSVVAGAGVMVVFWAGTLPVLLGVGAAASRAAGPLRRHAPAVAAALVVLLGLLVASRGADLLPGRGDAGPSCHAR